MLSNAPPPRVESALDEEAEVAAASALLLLEGEADECT